jgi:hypothetical protein
MSLINDALKRARQAQPTPTVPIAADPSLQPVLEAPRSSEPILWWVPGIGVAILLAACLFLFLWWRDSARPARSMTAAERTPGRPALVVSTGESRLPGPVVDPAPANTNTHESAAPPSKAGPESQPIVAETHASPSTNATSLPSSSPQQSAASPGQTVQTNQTSSAVDLTDTALANLKLQGIFYRSLRASALINGRTLFIGDDIDGATVTAIERQAVQVQFNGRTHSLKLN